MKLNSIFTPFHILYQNMSCLQPLTTQLFLFEVKKMKKSIAFRLFL